MNTISGLSRWFRHVAIVAAGPITAMGVNATAAEYFVSPAGKDTASGKAEAEAFATLSKGISVLKPGDTLTMLPGTYRESVVATLTGMPDAPITIRAKYPGTVLMRGDRDLYDFHLAEGMKYTYWTAFSQRVEGVAERSGLWMYKPMLSVTDVEQNLGSFYQDADNGRLYVHTSDSAHPDFRALAASVTDGCGLAFESSRHVIVDGLSFTGYNHRDYGQKHGSRTRWGLMFWNGEGIQIRRCTAFLNSGGIHLKGGRDQVIEDCYAFANFSPFQDIGGNILGWGIARTTFRNNVVENFQDIPSSAGDITFYGGAPEGECLMEGNIAIHAGQMVKGGFGEDTVERGNVALGRGAYFYRTPDATNLLLRDNESLDALRNYADPITHDYRLQSDAPLRGAGPDGADPGPHPYKDEVFYVSPEGNDAAAGTSLKHAWRTLAHAARNARPGQTVYVTAGAYRESLKPAHSGMADAPIRFFRYGRDRVVLEGGGLLAAGIDLTGRSHVHVKGFTVRNFAECGVRIEGGEGMGIEQVMVKGAGGDAVSITGARDVLFMRNMVHGSQGAGLRLARSSGIIAIGNLFDANAMAGIACDDASARELWSDQNAFAPSQTVLASIENMRFDTLSAWREASGLDPGSLAAMPGYRDEADGGLRPDSALLGRGPMAAPIGPYLRYIVQAPLPIERVAVHATTTTTADIEWWTPTRQARTSLAWGETPECDNRLDLSPSVFHTASLIGLEPDTEYFFRVTAPATVEEVRIGPYADTQSAPMPAVLTAPQRFQTPKADAPARTFHVSLAGDDRWSGLSPQAAWRTISHAAGAVRAGDTVFIHAGEYEECVLVRATGDEGRPVTFRAAPGETVWMTGSDRNRATAFRLAAKHHVHLDGLHFREFRYVPHGGDVISVAGGSHHRITRCFYDGRVSDGYMANFVRASGARNLLVENCVMINGMGEGLVFHQCPGAVVRHSVFYNNFIRAMSFFAESADDTLTLSHNLICDNIPAKTGNALIRLGYLEALRADHNGYFSRIGPDERRLVEAHNIGGARVGHRTPGSYLGERLMLADIQRQTGQEKGSFFGNPGIGAAKELTPSQGNRGEWLKVEMRWNGKAFETLGFADFFAHPNSPFARSKAGKPIGLDPKVFH